MQCPERTAAPGQFSQLVCCSGAILLHSRVPVSVECQSGQSSLSTSPLPTVSLLQLVGNFLRCRHGCLGTISAQISIFKFSPLSLWERKEETLRRGQSALSARRRTNSHWPAECSGAVSSSPLGVINLLGHPRTYARSTLRVFPVCRCSTEKDPFLGQVPTACHCRHCHFHCRCLLPEPGLLTVSSPVRPRLDHTSSWLVLIRHNSDSTACQ